MRHVSQSSFFGAMEFRILIKTRIFAEALLKLRAALRNTAIDHSCAKTDKILAFSNFNFFETVQSEQRDLMIMNINKFQRTLYR